MHTHTSPFPIMQIGQLLFARNSLIGYLQEPGWRTDNVILSHSIDQDDAKLDRYDVFIVSVYLLFTNSYEKALWKLKRQNSSDRVIHHHKLKKVWIYSLQNAFSRHHLVFVCVEFVALVPER